MADIAAPSEATPAPEAKETADFDKKAPAPAAEKKDRPRDRVNSAISDLKKRTAEMRAAREADDSDEPAPAPKAKAEKPEPKADSKAEAKAEKAADKIEALGGDAPDQRKGESDENYALRLVKVQRELEAEKRAAKAAKDEAAKEKAEAAKLRKVLDDGKANPLKVLKHLGISYEDLARGIVDGKYGEPKDEPTIPPEFLEKIERLEAAEKTREAEAAKKAAEEKRSNDIASVQKFLDDNADDFPLSSAMSWAASNVVADAYASGETDVTKLLKSLEANLEANVTTLVKTERGRKKLAKLDPELKSWLQKELGIELPKAPKSDEDDESPKSLAEVRTEPPARKKKTKADRMAEALAELRAKRKKGGDDEDDDD